jgi:glucose-6-phosphate isomerase
MKRPGWIVGLSFLVSAVVLVHTGWLGSRTSAATAVGPVSAEVKPRDADRLHTPAGWRYRHNQSTSWRSSLLQQ